MPTKLYGHDRETEHEREDEHGDNHRAEIFTYDSVGNRLTAPNSKLAYTYNQGNELTSDGKHQNEYDRNGNLVKKVEVSDDGKSIAWLYSYDYENRFIKVTKNENGTITTSEYKYDPLGRRIEKNVTDAGVATATQYVYDSQNIILEYDADNNVGNRYIQGPGIDEHLAVATGKDIYYYHADGLGSIVALTDSSGKTAQTYQYDSFGNLKDQKSRVKQPFNFTGREWDKEAGLYYYRARYYDSKNGRFTLQKDPIGLEGGINLYSYVNNLPTTLVDPTGTECQVDVYRTEALMSSGINAGHEVDSLWTKLSWILAE